MIKNHKLILRCIVAIVFFFPSLLYFWAFGVGLVGLLLLAMLLDLFMLSHAFFAYLRNDLEEDWNFFEESRVFEFAKNDFTAPFRYWKSYILNDKKSSLILST
jgi:hypothetical protein